MPENYVESVERYSQFVDAGGGSRRAPGRDRVGTTTLGSRYISGGGATWRLSLCLTDLSTIAVHTHIPLDIVSAYGHIPSDNVHVGPRLASYNVH